MNEFLATLAEEAKPLMRRHEPFGALGDLTQFVPQDRQTAAAIRSALLMAGKNGLTRFAIVNPAALVKLQYKRITEGMEVDFFTNGQDARTWLRDGSAPRMSNTVMN